MWRTIFILALVIASSLAEDDTENSENSLSQEEEEEMQENTSRDDKLENKQVEVEMENLSRKKVKIKKKHKKILKEMLMAGILIKSALLPLAIGFLKLLTGKALMVTLMALGLITALTFRSASDKGTTTEIINLVPHKHHHRAFSHNIPDNMVVQYLMSR